MTQGIGNAPEGDSRIKETTSWTVYGGHSISHSLPIEPIASQSFPAPV